jgi:hypothetical protein
MSPVKPLEPARLRRCCNPETFTFETTAELEELTEIIGQARGVEAVRFGMDMRQEGYNLFVLGPPAIGKHALVRQFLEQEAAGYPGCRTGRREVRGIYHTVLVTSDRQ